MDFQRFARDMERLTNVDGLYAGARFNDIGSDPDLTAFLLEQLDPGGARLRGSTDALRSAVLDLARDSRGGPVWAEWLGVPRHHPESLRDHQLRNLVERLYLSAPGQYGMKPLYGEAAADRARRDGAIVYRGVLPLMGACSLLAGGWVLSRRGKRAAEAAARRGTTP